MNRQSDIKSLPSRNINLRTVKIQLPCRRKMSLNSLIAESTMEVTTRTLFGTERSSPSETDATVSTRSSLWILWGTNWDTDSLNNILDSSTSDSQVKKIGKKLQWLIQDGDGGANLKGRCTYLLFWPFLPEKVKVI